MRNGFGNSNNHVFFSCVVKPISDANASELPTWVTKVISNDSDIATNATPRPAMGKWGRGLEVDKVRWFSAVRNMFHNTGRP